MLKISKVATRFQDITLVWGLSQSLGVCLYMSRVAWPAPNYRLQADGRTVVTPNFPGILALVLFRGKHPAAALILFNYGGQARAVELACILFIYLLFF